MKLILASSSPRRQELLREAGFQFQVRLQTADESFPADLPVEDVALHIAMVKAAAVEVADDEVLLAADTIVAVSGRILGKPADRAEAIDMLHAYSARKHQVISGVCLRTVKTERAFSVSTAVEFAELTREEIEYYVDRYQPYDKAGAYAIQEWIGMNRIRGIEGCYYNVMGLPMNRLYEELRDFVGLGPIMNLTRGPASSSTSR